MTTTTTTTSDGPWVEVPEELGTSERACAFEAFFYWLLENHCSTLGLPDEAVAFLVMELCDGQCVPAVFGEAVGVSVISDRRQLGFAFHDELRMIVAVGDRSLENDVVDYYACLTTVAHELGHLADFWSVFRTTPKQAAISGRISEWAKKAANCHGHIEDVARSLCDEYVDTHDVVWAP
jgi:hypothetical protein